MPVSQPEIRVFISSTFRDLQAEREYLIKKIFPELRDLSHKRGVEFTEIDLRWGIPEEDAGRGNIIRVCLDEIDKCRPFFIGILGSRYGTAPTFDAPEVIEEMRREYPWIEDALRDKMSVTEMEILHGVLLNPEYAYLAHFYFRDPSAVPSHLNASGAEHVAEDSEENHRRLNTLKSRIRESGVAVREGFSDIETLGRWVRADLLRLIYLKYPAEVPTPLRKEQLLHEAFALTRRRAYVAKPSDIERLNAHAAGDGPPLIITGESGSGKSSLISHWLSEYKAAHPETFVVAHYVGTYTSRREDVMRHIMAEIKAHFAIDDELPTSDMAMLDAFPLWLAKAQTTDGTSPKIILAIDAANQLEGIGPEMKWLPEHIPPFVRLIVSTTAGTPLDEMHSRDWPVLELTPLTVEDRERIITKYFEQYRKRLTSKQLARVAADANTACALYLRTVLEELRLFGSYEDLNSQIELLLSSETIDDLFQHVLARMENDYGAGVIQRIMTRLWASRRGLTETELLGIGALTRLDLSIVLNSLEFHLINRDGKLNFFHDYLRRAVEHRYIATAELQKAAHKQLAEYFASQPVDDRRIDEEPWHWVRVEELGRLKFCVGDLRVFKEFSDAQKFYELIGYWRHFEQDTAFHAYHDAVATVTDSQAVRESLGDYFMIAGEFASAANFFEMLVAELDTPQTNPAEYARVLRKLGHALQAQSKFEHAEEYLRKAILFYEQSDERGSSNHILALDSLATLLFFKRELDEAESLLRSGLAMLLNDQTLRLNLLVHLASLLGKMRKALAADEIFEAAYSESCRLNGARAPDSALILVSWSYVILLDPIHDTTRSIELLQSALATLTLTLGLAHPYTIVCLTNLGFAYKSKKEYDLALRNYEKALESAKRTYGAEHLIISDLYSNLAALSQASGQREKNKEYNLTALAIRRKLLGDSHVKTAIIELAIARSLNEEGKIDESYVRYHRFFPVLLTSLGHDDPSTTRSYQGYKEVLSKLKLHEELIKLKTAFGEE